MISPELFGHKFNWSEDQRLHVAVCYNNPMRWETRFRLLNDFRAHMVQSANVALYVGEIAYGDRPFEVTTEGNPRDFRFRLKDILWHKENLLNAIIARWPADWKYGAIIDGDFHMTRHDWALEAIHQLQHHDFVQLFSSYASMSSKHSPFRLSPGFAYNYCHGKGSFKCKGHESNYEKCSNGPAYPGAPGGAWSFTREAFDSVGGLLDTCILGSGDWHMAFGLIGEADKHADMRAASPVYVDHIQTWQRRAFHVVRGNIGYVQNHAIHSFHGSYAKRGYGSRVGIMTRHKFNPDVHIMRNWQGLYRWSPEAPAPLISDVRRYFHSRDEDDPNLAQSEKTLV